MIAMHIMNRVAKLCGFEAPTTLLFRHPTLGEFEKALKTWIREQESVGNSAPREYVTQEKERGRAASISFYYAHTNVQLYEQLFELGYTPVQLQEVAAVYDLSLSLFSALLRPDGKPFVSHLVGTASILALHGAEFTVISGGLLHAAYSFGEFGSLRFGLTNRKRNRVRAVIGDDAEELVYRYTFFPWNARAIESLPNRVPGMSRIERNLVFMRLANELQEGADASLLYCAAQRRLLKTSYLRLSVKVAEAMQMRDLAGEPEESHRRNEEERRPGRPELGRREVYSTSTLTRLRLAARRLLQPRNRHP